jgi:hypothetical protein
MCLVRLTATADVPGMKRTLTVSLAIATLTLCLAVPVLAADTVTICHAAGLAGTTQFTTLTIPESAASAHFNDDGTPAAGHEDDYLGACAGDIVTTTTTVIEETIVTVVELPTDTGFPTTTPTTLPYDEVGSVVAGLTVTASVPFEDPSLTSGLSIAALQTAGSRSATPGVAMTELPFTGASTGSLAVLAFGLLTAGIGLLKLNRTSSDRLMAAVAD